MLTLRCAPEIERCYALRCKLQIGVLLRKRDEREATKRGSSLVVRCQAHQTPVTLTQTQECLTLQALGVFTQKHGRPLRVSCTTGQGLEYPIQAAERPKQGGPSGDARTWRGLGAEEDPTCQHAKTLLL